MYGEFLVITGLKANGDMSWFNDLYNPIPEVILDKTTWDCRIKDYTHLRVSREDNSLVPCAKSGKSALYNRYGLVSMPQKQSIVEKSTFNNPYEDRNELYFEKKLRMIVDRLLVAENRDNVASGKTKILTVYAPWNPAKHSKTSRDAEGTFAFRPLDHIFVDSAVGNIMTNYFGTDDTMADPLSFYTMLEQMGNAESFFSRGADGMYSIHAQENFGYPCNRIINGNPVDGYPVDAIRGLSQQDEDNSFSLSQEIC